MNVRIMPCLDMQNGTVIKGIQFVNIRDAGDPVACCRAPCEAGGDELLCSILLQPLRAVQP